MLDKKSELWVYGKIEKQGLKEEDVEVQENGKEQMDTEKLPLLKVDIKMYMYFNFIMHCSWEDVRICFHGKVLKFRLPRGCSSTTIIIQDTLTALQ